MIFNTRNFRIAAFVVLLIRLMIGAKMGYAQQPTPIAEYEKYAELYPNDNGVITDYWREYRISMVGDSLEIIAEQYQEILVLENPTSWIKDRAYSSSFREIVKLEAYTLVPARRKFEKVQVEDFNKSYDKNTFVFYDDTEWINYSYPEVSKGCKIVTRQQWKLNNPHFIGQFFFSSYTPTVQARIKIVADTSVSIQHGLFNEEFAEIKYKTKKMDNGKIEYMYWANNLEKIKDEVDNPSFNYLAPSVHLNISHYLSNNDKISVMSSLEDLHNWYSTFIHDLEIDESIKELANSIVAPKDSDYEKTRKIFYWVQSNIKYIAFEQGMRGLIPHQADYVLQKRYGDCKDMSSLLVGLLRSQDIPANYTWIGTRDLPYKYSETPSPLIDNHMIASIELKDKTIFLDATGSYTPIGLPTAMIQGKESLISSGHLPKIVEVPIVSKDTNLMIDSSYIKLENGTIIGKANLKLTGLANVANTYKLINKTSTGEENYLKRLLSKGSNKFFLDSYETFNVKNLDDPIKIDYNFRIENYYKSIGDEIYVNLCLDKSLSSSQIIDRSTPIENDFKYTNKSVTVLELPNDYSVSYLPEKSSMDSDNFGFSIIHEVKGNKIYTTKEFYVDYLLMYPKDFENWNNVINSYSQAVRTSIVLTRNSN